MCSRQNKPPGPLRTNSLKKKKKKGLVPKEFWRWSCLLSRVRVSSQILAALSLGKDNCRFSFKRHISTFEMAFSSQHKMKFFCLQDLHHFHSSFFLFTQIRTPNLLEFLFDLFCSRIQTKIAVTQKPHTPFGTKSRVTCEWSQCILRLPLSWTRPLLQENLVWKLLGFSPKPNP